ncbi:MAG TPA: class I SAM-dependent methyltransferase [Gallionella sp.]|nr:class I SAM-dependent methyltransferase [Gallionella sp.]
MPLKEKLKKVPGLVRLVRLCRIVISPSYRSQWLLQLRKPDNLFQPCSLTVFDRYPRIFYSVKQMLSGVSDPRLLSFGCSTGEEVFTLRHYFPRAEIVGIDINPRSIAVCKKKCARLFDARLRFELTSSTEAEASSHYDAVFCMAVLRHGALGQNRPEVCDHLIRFEDFEKTVSDFCRVLKPGGYLVIRHSNFRFTDTRVAAEFEVVPSDEAWDVRNSSPLYGRDNRLLPDAEDRDFVFRKLEWN